MRQKCAEHFWGRTSFGRYRVSGFPWNQRKDVIRTTAHDRVQGQGFMCYLWNPRNINLFARVPDREDRWPGWLDRAVPPPLNKNTYAKKIPRNYFRGNATNSRNRLRKKNSLRIIFSGVTKISRNSTWKSLWSVRPLITQNNSWGIHFLVIT